MQFLSLSLLTTALLCLGASSAFAPAKPQHTLSKLNMVSTTIPPQLDSSINRDKLMYTAQRLKAQYGVFIIDQQAKRNLEQAVVDLEKLSMPPTNANDLIGDWTLVCTSTLRQGVDTSAFPNPIQKLTSSITDAANKYVNVEQRIKSTTTNSNVIDRIDHVIEYMPPDNLRDFMENVPAQLSSLNINPLDVSKSALCLIHKASTVDRAPPLITKLSLSSIVLNVAGQSQMLSPDGKDIAGINLPPQLNVINDFVNAGEFETTYLDDELRVSRGKQGGMFDQLRVFIRKDKLVRDNAKNDVVQTELNNNNIDLSGSGPTASKDVDDSVDPEFNRKVVPEQDIADEQI